MQVRHDAGEVIRSYARQHTSASRALTGATAAFELDDEDTYWSSWLDGAGKRARRRINQRTAAFTDLDAYRFALHEVLGHALQYANLTATAETTDVAGPDEDGVVMILTNSVPSTNADVRRR